MVNLDANFPQAGFVKFPYDKLSITEGTPIVVHDLLSENKYTWNKAWNYVMLDPKVACAHIFEINW